MNVFEVGFVLAELGATQDWRPVDTDRPLRPPQAHQTSNQARPPKAGGCKARRLTLFAVGYPSSRPRFSPCRIGPSTRASGPASQQPRGDGLAVNALRIAVEIPVSGPFAIKRGNRHAEPHLGTEGLQVFSRAKRALAKAESQRPTTTMAQAQPVRRSPLVQRRGGSG